MRYKTIPLLLTIGIFILANVYGEEVQMKISSTAFEHNGQIPKKYTCDGSDVNPPLKFESIPDEAKSLALIIDDPDAPVGTWVHWVLWNIDPKTTEIQDDYGGPCPPSGTHRYFFKLYALDTTLNLGPNVTKRDIESSIKGHILAKAELIGLYKRIR
jgi:phosphatidylethanolamine-binding protein (PEBP) family uncharacterized protein